MKCLSARAVSQHACTLLSEFIGNHPTWSLTSGIRGKKICKRKTKTNQNTAYCSMLPVGQLEGGGGGKRNPLMQSAWPKPSLAHGDSLRGGKKSTPSSPSCLGKVQPRAGAQYLLPTKAPIKHSGGNYSWQHCNYADSRPNRKCRLCFPVLIRAALGRRRGKNEHFHGNFF